MKKYLYLFIALVVSIAAHAQDDQVYDISYYQNQYSKLYKDYVKEPTNVANTMAMALFYSDTLNPMRNYAMAMNYIVSAEKHYIEIVEDRSKYKEVSKLIKKKITVALVRKHKKEIIQKAVDYLNSDIDMGEEELQSYADAFKGEYSVQRLVENKRLEARYRRALQSNTMSDYYAFMQTYPNTEESDNAARLMGILATESVAKARRETEVDSMLMPYLGVASVQQAANKRKSSIAYSNLSDNATPEDYNAFLTKYTGSDEYPLVLERMEAILEKDFAMLSTPRQYADFANRYPDNPLAEKAIEKLKKQIKKNHDMEALEVYLDQFPLDIDYNDIYLSYYKWHTEEGNKAPIERFIANNPNFPYKTAMSEDLAAAELFDQYNLNEPFVESDFAAWSSKVYHLTGKKGSYVALQRTLQQFIAARDWGKVLNRIEFFSLSFEDNCIDEVAELRSIVNASPVPERQLANVVCPSYDLKHPVMHPNGQLLFYDRNIEGRDVIYMARHTKTKKGYSWRGIGEVQFDNIDNNGLHIFCLYDNGNKMLLGLNGDILSASFADSVWTVDETLPEPVNSPYNDFDAFMLPEGEGILLASDRPGGYNMQPSGSYFHGDTAIASDIYYVPRTEHGWGKAINLGINVNSAYMECSPVISNDLKTLYFITDGHGLGYGDIYYTTRDNVNDWRCWTRPVNYGKETNSGYRESSITITDDEKKLIVSTNAQGRFGCYSVPTVHLNNNQFVHVTIKTGNNGMAIDIIDTKNGRKLSENQHIARESEWTSTFYSNKEYMILAECPGLYVPAMLFTPAHSTEVVPTAYDERTIVAAATAEHPITLHALQFKAGSSELYDYAIDEIDHLSDFLQSHPDLYAEFVIHVDGNDDMFCFNLSQSRGNELRNLLTNKGINPDRIVISAYGNSMTKRHQTTTSVSLIVQPM